MSRTLWRQLPTQAASQKPSRSITDNAKLQGLEKTCEEARNRKCLRHQRDYFNQTEMLQAQKWLTELMLG